MTLSDNDLESLRSIVVQWGDIQAEIKRAEQISRLSVGPSINELRYAGRILVSSLVQELDPEQTPLSTKEEELDHSQNLSERIAIAKQYLINADNDISDALFYFFQKRADDINRTYGAGAVKARNPEYGSFLDNLKDSRHLIIESRRNLNKRNENYSKLKPIREQLIANYFELQKSDALMAIEIRRHELETKKYKTVCAALAAIIVVLTALFFL
jgi:hypothetical protein